ncbi:DUF2207 domain-containing protein [Luteimonas vadosa]|uniref:DUF2207 domain-containing protein n=1 Tax=Luteimonas vadosa TaxID=1165507 RepID=A0ABP9E6G1_9GAMM
MKGACRWFLVVLVLLWPATGTAQERILGYDTLIEILAGGSLEITERIRVRAEGNQIRRGIYRDFPTRYTDRWGNRVVVDFDVLGVERDGQPEAWFTERLSNGVRVNTGNDDYLPVPAEYTYTLRYRTNRQLGFFDDHDELYFNAIGTGWAFPIDQGKVEVRLPEPVGLDALRAEGYSGARGMRGQDFTTAVPSPGVAHWTLTRTLHPGEGLTIVLSFPKGVVAEPTRAQRTSWLLQDNIGVLVALAGLLLLLGYCVIRWRQVGRDPAPGTIVVRYDPPEGYSPAGLRYMRRMKYDTRCFSADLLLSAVEGLVRIRNEKGLLGRKKKWQLNRRYVKAAEIPTSEQRALLTSLFPHHAGDLILDQENASTVQAGLRRHAAELADRFQPKYFASNVSSIGQAIVLAAVFGGGALLLGTQGAQVLVFALLALMAVTLVVFAIVIKAPTREGRKLMDAIEGFRRYLSVADKDDLARLPGPRAEGEPVLDAERFERLLPFAVALDVEDAWTDKFTLAVGAAAAEAAASGIQWYQGGGSDGIANLADSIGGGLSSQIASSSTPPGSSSGGGGGGSSGGGGGGGGGGGR